MKTNDKKKNNTTGVSPALRIGALILAGRMLFGTVATVIYALM